MHWLAGKPQTAHEAFVEFFQQHDKFVHMLLAIAVVCGVAWSIDRLRSGTGIAIGCVASFALLFVYEIVQGRFDPADIVANAAGCALVALFGFMRWRVDKRLE